jgi:AraC-like DNA-binding protein
MGSHQDERAANSPIARTVFRMRFEGDGCFMAIADGSPDMIVIKQRGESRIFFSGTRTKAAPVFYKDGMEFIGIRLAVGAFLPQLLPETILDSTTMLSSATARSFWLHDTALPLPDFEDADVFIERLERHGLITHDETVKATLQEQPSPESLRPELFRSESVRSVQRRFLKTTGMTQAYIRQIERALHAANLLRQGVSIADTVYEAGYFDQAHLTKAIKHMTGYTPGQIALPSHS